MVSKKITFLDLRSFIQYLEANNELVRINAQVDPNQEITIIQHRVLSEHGPALLFENVKGSSHSIVTNLFGTKKRVNMVFGGAPEEIGNNIVRLIEQMMPPKLTGFWKQRKELWNIAQARMRKVKTGPVMETLTKPADLNKIPVLTCWPKDSGPFFTLPLVHTLDPVTQKGNLGIYRLQRFNATSTGMHWQIEKGGGFHFHNAVKSGKPLEVSVILGGPPALTIAAIAPLPEGIDERILVAYMMGKPLDVILRKETRHEIPANAEFVLEGTVSQNDMKMEGPFGDHFGHYSHAAKYPVFRVKQILARKNAIYPATVVGKPVQEDFYIGQALQEMSVPVLKIIKPGVVDIWAYPETGFHPLAVMSVKERYKGEALKHALGMLGEGQVSLTKIMIVVDEHVNVHNFNAVSNALWQHLRKDEGIHLLSPSAQDTLDFTGPAMNTGSRLILIGTSQNRKPIRKNNPPDPPNIIESCNDINEMIALGPCFLIVQVKNNANLEKVREILAEHPITKEYLFHVMVSSDVPLNDNKMILWGWFTRFDPLNDLYPAKRVVQGNKLIFDFPIAIDARWKQGYPEPVEFDPGVEKRVNEQWSKYKL